MSLPIHHSHGEEEVVPCATGGSMYYKEEAASNPSCVSPDQEAIAPNLSEPCLVRSAPLILQTWHWDLSKGSEVCTLTVRYEAAMWDIVFSVRMAVSFFSRLLQPQNFSFDFTSPFCRLNFSAIFCCPGLIYDYGQHYLCMNISIWH